jgi:hypothetical protein
VQVLEHEHDRRVPAEVGQDAEQRLEQSCLRVAASVVEELVDRRHGAQRVDERRVGEDGAAELQAVPDEHARVGGGGTRLELADQPRLADAGLAGDERERREPVQRVVEGPELGGPADERGAGHAAEHDVHDGPAPRRVPAGEVDHRPAPLTRRRPDGLRGATSRRARENSRRRRVDRWLRAESTRSSTIWLMTVAV